jgi:hydrogenase maturation protein HypF
MNVDGIFAAGAELVNCFCMGKGKQAIMSQHIGDLKNLETLHFYQESAERFGQMFRFRTSLVVADLHPDYLSTRYAMELAGKNNGIPLMQVQHHHAHIAACMAEHGLEEPVIGISLDGVGYGTDGHIWGFEVMNCDLSDFQRLSHLQYVPQPGGDLATLQPWRMALAYIYQYINRDPLSVSTPFIGKLSPEKVSMVTMMIERNINTPLTSSAGRLFDAVAAILGLCTESTFHAEAPMRLENIINPLEKGAYAFNSGSIIDPEPVIQEILADIDKGESPGTISTRFHRAIARAILDSAHRTREITGLETVILSGGTFQNRFLLTLSEAMLRKAKFQVFTPEQFPANDGGIALGQMVIAAKRREMGLKA